MSMNRISLEYEIGVSNFIQFTIDLSTNKNMIRCPCLKCANLKKLSIVEVKDHLYFNGIDQDYRKWLWYGEGPTCGPPKRNSRVKRE